MSWADDKLMALGEAVGKQTTLSGHRGLLAPKLAEYGVVIPNWGVDQKLSAVRRVAADIGKRGYLSIAPRARAGRTERRVIRKPAVLAGEDRDFGLKRLALLGETEFTSGRTPGNFVLQTHFGAHHLQIDRVIKNVRALVAARIAVAKGKILSVPITLCEDSRRYGAASQVATVRSDLKGVAQREQALKRSFAPVRVSVELPAVAKRQHIAVGMPNRHRTPNEDGLGETDGHAFKTTEAGDRGIEAVSLTRPGQGRSDFESRIGGAIEAFFAGQARLPPSGMGGFDPRLSPAWAGLQLPG